MGNANVNEANFMIRSDHQVTTQRFNYFFNNKSRILMMDMEKFGPELSIQY